MVALTSAACTRESDKQNGEASTSSSLAPTEGATPSAVATLTDGTIPSGPEQGEQTGSSGGPEASTLTGEETTKGGAGQETTGSTEAGSSSESSTENEETDSVTSTSSTTTSSSSTSSSTTTSSTDGETVACQNGETRSCDEREDGSKIIFPGGIPQGSCKSGVETCVNGAWSACYGAIAPAPKDTCDLGNDDNCNGVPSDHCDCTAGETKPCGSDQGECRKGRVTCGPNGKWNQECVGEIKPSTERCDGRGRDEDCNGLADLKDPKCECLDGQNRVCSVAGRQGDCGLGSQRCSRGQFEAFCSPRFRVAREMCGARRDNFGQATGDEDCDGRVDESDVVTAEPTGCTYYFEDKDRDGYGATGQDIAVSQAGATYGCFCPTILRPGDWIRGTKNSANADCGDCVSGGDLVKPGAKAQSTPSSCLRELGRPNLFDYNCDGSSTPEGLLGYSCAWNGSDCVGRGYWHSEAPECGELETYNLPGDCFKSGDGECSLPMRQKRADVACR